MLKFHLPIPPSQNRCFRNIRVNLRVPTNEAKNWKVAAQALAKIAMKNQNWQITKNEKVVMELTYFWPDARPRDCDNPIKILADTLQQFVYDDDRWLLPRVMDFFIDRDNPRLELVFYRLGNEQNRLNRSVHERGPLGL